MMKHRTSAKPSARQRAGATRAWLIVGLLIAGVFAVFKVPASRAKIDEFFASGEETETSLYILHTAGKGPFRIMITENGTIDSLRNATMINTVEGSTTIISLVSEGTRVNGPIEAEIDGVVEFVETESGAEKTVLVRGADGEEKTYKFAMGPFTELLVEDRQQIKKGEYIAGDMLCELDSSTLNDKEKQQQIDVTTARADLEKAKKSLEIQESTNESNKAAAELAQTLAQLDLIKYKAPGGEYDQEKQTIAGEIKQFEEEQAMDQDTYEKVRDQARRGYTNLNNLEAARIKVTQQKILLDVKSSELNLLEKFTKKRTESELEQMAEETVRETKRVQLEGEAQMAGLTADHTARDLTLQVEDEKLERLQRQIKACRLIAPQGGEVVYASQNSRRSEPVVIEEGATVRERQAVINLPDLDQMKVDARIHESRISRISIGQPVEIYIDAVSNTTFHGILETVSSVPVPGNWPNTDLKEYEAGIRITDSKEMVRKLKPGMTAEIRIIVDDRPEDVMQIPVQSALSIADKYFAYIVKGNKPERRELKIGDANDEFLEILDGIGEGERVVMNPRTHFSREINELEAKLGDELEANRERVVTPNAAEWTGGPSGAGKGRPEEGGAGKGKGKAAGKSKAGGGEEQAAGGAAGGPPTPEKIMEMWDTNKDGVITKDESDMRGNFDKYDTDGDGKLTPEELKAGMSQPR